MSHLDIDAIVDLVTTEDRQRPAHLDHCSRCRAELESYEVVVNALRRGGGLEPPASARSRAHDLFGMRERLAGVVRRIDAALTFDSGVLAPAVAGVRSVASGSRQLLFQSPAVELDLAYPLGSSPAVLRGQATPAEGQASDLVALRPVTLRAAGTGTAPRVTCTDTLGSFRFASLGPGRYELDLELADEVVQVSFDVTSGDAGRDQA